MRDRVELTNSSMEPIRIGKGSTMAAAPASQQPWMVVTRARLVGPSMATWLPGTMPRAWRAAATAEASSWSCAHGTLTRSAPLMNVTAASRSAARRRRVMRGSGMGRGRTYGRKWWFGSVKQKVGFPDMAGTESSPPGPDTPKHRYSAALAGEIEARWQDRWEDEHTFEAPNPAGPLAQPAKVGGRPKLFILDMFPYPSGAGLHVGHPLGFIATDVYGRFKRMTGHNVLHTMGFDAFGLPAEQHAVQTGIHPRVNTEQNITTYRRQLRRLGLAHDPRRSVATTDVTYYRWTQWIFLQIFNAWYDTDADRARPIGELIDEFERGDRATPDGRPWASLDPVERRRIIDDHRLAYLADAAVNWCPGLGTVLANEEVTADGRSEIGNYPVFRRNLPQWMLRI